MNNKEIFLKAIHEKKKVEVFFDSQDKGKSDESVFLLTMGQVEDIVI
ncbi:hypothetical protein [Methanohalophilus portucalensis]|uniref:Uncharacterized protein n=1 Tax=Methanohalophilus portucalensis FDF-1 TaxID=523843 RepID=A0A1X7P3L6_9EURY|nr:hypothetical protein [Methanohalophilus portucalensis]SMH44398.1 hypothetical protein SAMN06264941_2057 [Methanohalophilus portucalensis FDF-1]